MKNVVLYHPHYLTLKGLSNLLTEQFPEVNQCLPNSESEIYQTAITYNASHMILGGDADMQTITTISEIQPAIPVLIIYRNFFRAIELKKRYKQVRGLAAEGVSEEDLAKLLRSFFENKNVYCSLTVNQIVESLRQNNRYSFPDNLPTCNLSKGEIMVLDLVRTGKRTGEIAMLLQLRPATISTVKSRLRKKLKLIQSAGLV